MSSFPPTIADAARLLAAGDLTAVDLTQQCLSRIDAFDGEIHAFHKVLRDESLSSAAASDIAPSGGKYTWCSRRYSPCREGCCAGKGQACTANSRVLEGNIAAEDATVIARLRDAGAIILGIVDTYEFAFGGRPTYDALFPPACNPVGPE